MPPLLRAVTPRTHAAASGSSAGEREFPTAPGHPSIGKTSPDALQRYVGEGEVSPRTDPELPRRMRPSRGQGVKASPPGHSDLPRRHVAAQEPLRWLFAAPGHRPSQDRFFTMKSYLHSERRRGWGGAGRILRSQRLLEINVPHPLFPRPLLQRAQADVRPRGNPLAARAARTRSRSSAIAASISLSCWRPCSSA